MNKKKLKKKVQSLFLFGRGYASEIRPRETPIQNIYYACIQKTGSQWVKAIFSDPRTKQYTQLLTYPQYRYESGEFHKQFPLYTFVPGLYISYDLYKEIEKPKHYKTFYVIRDPRDIVVSWYYSMLKTHGLMGRVSEYRNDLNKLSPEEGIAYCIHTLQVKFSFMRNWMQNRNDPQVLILKFEDLTKEPEENFKKIFDHCEIDIPDGIIYSVISDHSKEKMREKDLAKRKDKSESHYRSQNSSWQEFFTQRHQKLFTEVNGNLVEFLGY